MSAPGGLPRLLTESDPPPRVAGARRGEALIAAVAAAGLHGRGGGAFPTAIKLRAVASARGRRALVVNAAEGEPMSAKDEVLLSFAPQLVLDGVVLVAEAIGARDVVVALKHSSRPTQAALRDALAVRTDATRVRVRSVPNAYLTGEETALIHALNGGPATPTLTPPRPFERGLAGRPTLVANVETLAHVALIARHGAAWFRSIGTPEHPGSTLVTVTGAVTGPGVYEIAVGTPAATVIEQAGGEAGALRALLVGGYHGSWLAGEAIAQARLDNASLRRWDAALGAGVLVALPRSACPVAEVTRVVGWMAAESAGQCGPCVHGLHAIAGAVASLAAGTADADVLSRLARWSAQVTGRGACGHPDGVVRFLRTGLDVFADAFEDHRRYGPCDACDRRPVLDVPAVSRRAAA